MADILVYALHYEGAINKNSLGAVSEGARLAGELGGEAHVLVLGEGIPEELAASLGSYGASTVLVAEGPEGLAQPVVDAMAAAVSQGGYSYALFGGGLVGFEIGAGLAARLGAGVVMEVTAVSARGGGTLPPRPRLWPPAVFGRQKYSPGGGRVARPHPPPARPGRARAPGRWAARAR